MDDTKEINQETLAKDAAEENAEHQTNLFEDNQLQPKNLQQQKSQEQEELQQIDLPGEKQQQQETTTQQQPPQTIDYEQDVDEDDYEDDDDEEKDTSQKLVIDIPEEEEEEKDEEEDDEDDVVAINDLPPLAGPAKKESEKISPKPEKLDAVITLSDGEEDVTNDETISKPGKVQKRRSVGAENEDHLRLKRRKINVAGAPKLPLTGYLRYLNDRREAVRKEHPSKTHTEHNKMIGEEWHALPADVKNSYLKAADVEKQRYVKELQSFLKSRPDILASELAKNKIRKTGETNSPNPAAVTTSSSGPKAILKDKAPTIETNKATKDINLKEKVVKEIVSIASTSQQANDKLNNEKPKRKRTPTPPSTNTNIATSPSTAVSTSTSSSSIVNATPGEIPIFTNEFLEHNKIYDMELRSIRKSKTDLEQQNYVLEKHVENMKFGVEKMITENNELEEKNRLLEIYLDKLKRKLALALSALPLPTAPNGATVENIDNYMQDLYKMSTSNSTGPATLNKAKDIIRKLDLQIQL